MARINTSYAQRYVVVAKSADTVTLRVVDDALYRTYWQEFISARIESGLIPPEGQMYLKIEQVPPPVELIDQYSNFVPETPLVYLVMGDRMIRITDKVAVNRPNTDVPGLYRLDYRINFTGENAFTSVFWSSYVSIQQRPLLRKAAAGWVRDGYVIKTLNRLVMEPQFMEAMHASGEPLYGFMQANQHPSIRASRLQEYADAQAWGSGRTEGGDASTIFITGARLPQGSIVVYQRRLLQLQEPVYPDVAGIGFHMDAHTHGRVTHTYPEGHVLRAGKDSYICVKEAGSDVSPNDPDHWRKGYLYRFSALESGTFVLPYGRLPIGQGGIEHIWATVDNEGYPFWVDIARTTSVGAYRGHYDRKNFADYNSDDIVSYVGENAIRLFVRKRTDIQDPETLAYPPGHYLNPAWEEIYFHMEGDLSPLLSDYSIIPHTNAANAIIAKTWSVSEEMCSVYAHMVGIPQSIVKACGAKWSALLFALLVRTRNTYDGFRICMEAVGLDIQNLRLSEPSIAYYCKPEGASSEEHVTDIYAQHANLRKLLGDITTLCPPGEETEKDGNLRYKPGDSNTVQQYDADEEDWVDRYRFEALEPSQNFNNRYYDADLNVLARLAEDAVKDLGDGKQWVKASAWAGEYSRLVGDVLAYEIPIYVWIRLHLHLYDETRIEMKTGTYSGALDCQRCGQLVLELFPTRYFNFAIHDFVEIPTGVFVYENNAWTEMAPSRTNPEKGSRIYEFPAVPYPIRIRAVDMDKNRFVRYWQSSHTFGLLGLKDPDADGNFRSVLDPGVTDESDLMLINGHVGVTAIYAPKELLTASAEALRWLYILGDNGAPGTWHLSDDIPFSGWDAIGTQNFGIYAESVSELKAALVSITDHEAGGNTIPFEWDGDVLVLKDACPSRIYMKDSDGAIIGAMGIVRGAFTLTDSDWAEYAGEESTPSVRIAFATA